MDHEIAIRVEGLGKLYRLGQTIDLKRTFRETLMTLPRAVGRKALRALRLRPTAARLNDPQSPIPNPQSPTDAFWALRDINLEIKRGEVVGIIGRNGAGKSTLLKILSRITYPTTGQAEIHGRVASLLEVGTGFNPELTGRENIYLNGSILGMRKAEIDRKFDEIVAFAEIERFLDTPVKRYSSGMYVRLAFAVAAHLEPEILIVDEVLAVGDFAFQRKCLGKMSDVASSGRTILFVSHNLDAVRHLCGRGIVLHKGSKVCDNTAASAIQQYVEGSEMMQREYDIRPPKERDAVACAYKLRIEDKDGNPVTHVAAGQPWQARIYFQVNHRTRHLVIALGMRTSLQTALRTTWTTPQQLEPGGYTALFQEETMYLAPGRYSLAVGLSEYERVLHYVEDAGALEIGQFSEFSDGFRPLRMNAGIILNPMRTVVSPHEVSS